MAELGRSAFVVQPIHTARLDLLPLRRAHAAGLFDALRHPDIYRFIARAPPSTMAELEDRYSQLEARRSADGEEVWLNWAAKERASGLLVGLVEVTVQKDKKAMLAYLFAPSVWGKGYAAEVCAGVLANVGQRAGVSTFEATVDTRNLRSRKLLERLQFKFIEERESADIIGGEKSREVLYRFQQGLNQPLTPKPGRVSPADDGGESGAAHV